MEDRIIVLITNFHDNKLTSIHALEIIDYEMTGIYFHAYFNKNIKCEDDMYYYYEYEYSDDEYYLEEFKKFVGDSKTITYKNQEQSAFAIKIKVYDLNEVGIKYDKTSLTELAKEYDIIVEGQNVGGLIDCTILGRIICKAKKSSIKEISMTGKKPQQPLKQKNKYNAENKIQENKTKKTKTKTINKQTKTQNISIKEDLVVIDTDTTGLDPKKDCLVAIHAVEIKEGKFTGLFFHSFINKRAYNYDYMYYLASYNYSIDINKKMKTFLNFIKKKKIVSHNIEFDVRFINKILSNLNTNINTENCFCTMKALKEVLTNYKLKDCADFYKVNIKENDFHKGIIDVVALGRIVCKMLENDDNLFNVNKYIKNNENENKLIKKKENEPTEHEKSKNKPIENKKSEGGNIQEDTVYISKTGKKYHLTEKCGNMKHVMKINKNDLLRYYDNPELCKNCAKKLKIY